MVVQKIAVPLKTCSKCGLTKSLEEFYKSKRRAKIDGRENICKECHRTYDKEKEKDNKVKYRNDPDFRKKVKARRVKSVKKWMKTDHGKLYAKNYRKRDYVRDRNRKESWRWRHTDRGRKITNEYTFYKRKYNTGYRIRGLLSRSIHKLVKNIQKTWKTMSLIGCSIEDLKGHLQKTAIANGYCNFDINNYSSQEYHIDHVIPCASFDLTQTDQIRQCFHYTNLQILKAEINIFKRAKIGFNMSSFDENKKL